MNENGGITPVMPVGNGSDGFGFGGGGGFWIFALLILMGMSNGGGFGWGNNNFANAIGYENLATSNEVQRGFDSQNNMANQREILAAVNAQGQAAINATNQTFHDSLAATQSLYNELQRDVAANAVSIANLQANQNACCCDVKQLVQSASAATNAAIAQSNYDGAMRDAATNANFTAQIQSVKDAIAQDKIEALQAQISQLQLAQAVSGVVRYPTSTVYGVPSPCFNMGCGCGGNI